MRMRRTVIDAAMSGTVIATALFGVVAEDARAGDFETGVVAYLEGDLDTAAAHWRPLAEGGDRAAQFNLGSLYVPVGGAMLDDDVAEAAWWFGLAARQGHAQAQYELGVIYRDGGDDGTAAVSVPADGEMALKWLTAAARQGHGPAQADLGLVYMGRGPGALAGLEPDMAVAWQWLSLARDQGDKVAMAALAELSGALTADERWAAEQAAAALVDRNPARRTGVGF